MDLHADTTDIPASHHRITLTDYDTDPAEQVAELEIVVTGMVALIIRTEVCRGSYAGEWTARYRALYTELLEQAAQYASDRDLVLNSVVALHLESVLEEAGFTRYGQIWRKKP